MLERKHHPSSSSQWLKKSRISVLWWQHIGTFSVNQDSQKFSLNICFQPCLILSKTVIFLCAKPHWGCHEGDKELKLMSHKLKILISKVPGGEKLQFSSLYFLHWLPKCLKYIVLYKSIEIVERINDPTGRKSSHGGGHRRSSAKDGRIWAVY